ncbi:hypothetical protein SAMN05660236_1879 [Ohtaekwangia koreensis]|uniref:Uncharacterized protein n=1 Tax=Ohtaekwangia koreensis TaxID=688867 RepID=A0A1T5K7D7_9BACT|nr:hypothetical protein SAMN05660236_1879 [Ohtaekwangia koreensis]
MLRTILFVCLIGMSFRLVAQTLYPASWTDLINVTVNADNSVIKNVTGFASKDN